MSASMSLARVTRARVLAEREAVQRRDRNTCQVCRRLVRWDDRRSAAGGTYVELDGRMVVACLGCAAEVTSPDVRSVSLSDGLAGIDRIYDRHQSDGRAEGQEQLDLAAVEERNRLDVRGGAHGRQTAHAAEHLTGDVDADALDPAAVAEFVDGGLRHGRTPSSKGWHYVTRTVGAPDARRARFPRIHRAASALVRWSA